MSYSSVFSPLLWRYYLEFNLVLINGSRSRTIPILFHISTISIDISLLDRRYTLSLKMLMSPLYPDNNPSVDDSQLANHSQWPTSLNKNVNARRFHISLNLRLPGSMTLFIGLIRRSVNVVAFAKVPMAHNSVDPQPRIDYAMYATRITIQRGILH